MKHRYTRLKLKMLLFVIISALAAAVASIVLMELVVDGIFQDPFAKCFVWGAQTFFGQTEPEALETYQHYIRNYKQEILTAGMLLLLLISLYVLFGRIARWMEQLRRSIRQVASHPERPLDLPKELLPLRDDLDALRRQVEGQAEAVKENEQRRQDLIAFLAHDLKTPLTSVVGYLTLLKDNPGLTHEQRAKFTGIALDKARRLEELLGEFFDISRMDLDSGPEEHSPIQLSMLLEQLADEFYPLFAEKELQCAVEIEHHLMVLGDPDKLARVFDNVLRNAVSYSIPGGQVYIQAQKADGQAQVTIRNEGLEIPEGELANNFRNFYRLDAARSSRTGGAGLGLAIAKEIVERHGGGIRAESNGRLTSFTITLPLYEEEI